MAEQQQKERRPRPWQIDPGTVIGTKECPQCKGTVQMKINAAQKVYHNCPHGDSQGNSCGYQVRFGAWDSEKMRKRYIEARDGPQKTLTANENRAPRPKVVSRNVTKQPAPQPDAPEKPAPKGDFDEYGI